MHTLLRYKVFLHCTFRILMIPQGLAHGSVQRDCLLLGRLSSPCFTFRPLVLILAHLFRSQFFFFFFFFRSASDSPDSLPLQSFFVSFCIVTITQDKID